MNNIGQVVREERDAVGLTQQEIARRIPVNRSLVSRWESGETAISPEMLQRLAEVIGSERLYREAALAISPVFCSPALDGGVDLHRANVLHVWRREMGEAVAAITAVEEVITRAPERVTDADREAIRSALGQVIDLEATCEHLVGTLARTYALDLVALYREHRQKLAARGYTRTSRQAAEAEVA